MSTVVETIYQCGDRNNALITSQKTTYQCDICKKEVSDKDELTIISLPVRASSGGYMPIFHSEIHKFDLCKDCLEQYVQLIENHFAKITDTPYGYGEIKVEIKFPSFPTQIEETE